MMHITHWFKIHLLSSSSPILFILLTLTLTLFATCIDSMTMKSVASISSSSSAAATSSSMKTNIAAMSTTTTTTTNPSTNNSNNNTGRRVVLHWFRYNDLRLHDNPAFVHSTTLLATTMSGSTTATQQQQQQQQQQHDVIIPIFCFDTTKVFGNACTTTFTKTIKCSSRRAQFIIDSIIDLREQLQTKCQSQLVVTMGDPKIIFHRMIQYIRTTYNTNNIRVVCQEDVASEERQAAKDIRLTLRDHYPNAKEKLLLEVWGSTMYERNELPFDRVDLNHMPNGFTPFRNIVEKKCMIRKPLAIPKYVPFPNDWPDHIELHPTPPTVTADEEITSPSMSDVNDTLIASTTYIPTLHDLGYTLEQINEIQVIDERGIGNILKGGETAGLQRVQDYIWEQDLLKDYFDTRNGMIGINYSTKFSPWLAHGNISPRYIVQQCHNYEQERVKNKSTYWVVFELLWRDFCKFFTIKHERKIFYLNGITNKRDIHPDDKIQWNKHTPSFEAWKYGRTGYPLVDANMREMMATGFMSNRGRQNVASFLALDMKYDWRHGGDWFESNLIDYDVYSNWVNWCAAAGMTGGRINRFNIVKQSRDYDQHGEYVKRWIPELKNVPVEYVHEPWKMTQFQQIEYNCHLGLDYPNPIIPPFAYNSVGKPGSGRHDNNHKNGNNNSSSRKEKERRPNNSNRNRHQKYEMTGLKEGKYNF